MEEVGGRGLGGWGLCVGVAARRLGIGVRCCWSLVLGVGGLVLEVGAPEVGGLQPEARDWGSVVGGGWRLGVVGGQVPDAGCWGVEARGCGIGDRRPEVGRGQKLDKAGGWGTEGGCWRPVGGGRRLGVGRLEVGSHGEPGTGRSGAREAAGWWLGKTGGQMLDFGVWDVGCWVLEAGRLGVRESQRSEVGGWRPDAGPWGPGDGGRRPGGQRFELGGRMRPEVGGC